MSDVVVRIQNVDMLVQGDIPKDVRDEIRSVMSYVIPNFKYMSRYKRMGPAGWDGTKTVALYAKGHPGWLVAPTGLLSYLREILANRGVPYSLVDEREPVVPSAGWSTDALDLRDYQQDVVKEILRRQRGVLKAATGSGKTRMAIDAIIRAGCFPAVFYVTTCDLLEQAYDYFSKYVRYNGQPVEIGRVGAGHCDIRPITVATVQSCQLALDGKFTKFDDETPVDKTDLSEMQKKHIVEMVRGAQFIFCDECFAYHTQVLMPDGKTEQIGKLVNQRYNGLVKTFNPATGTFEDKRVVGWIRKAPENPVVRIGLGNLGGITCTDNHVFHTVVGKKQAKDLRCGDAIIAPVPHGYITVRSNRPSKITGRYRHERDVYCLTVEDNHTFVANQCVVNNCQHTSCDTVQSILNNSDKARFRIGGSASPWRDDGLDILIEACFGRRLCDISASFLIQRGFLLKPYVTFNHFRQAMGPTSTFNAHYTKYVVQNQARNEWIAQRAQFHTERGRPTIVLVKWIKHAEILADLIPGAEMLIGTINPKARKEKLDKMRARDLMCIIGTSLLDEGVDVPAAGAGIFAGGGKSSTRELQRVGRFIRKDPADAEKDCAYIEEFFDHTKWLSHHAKARRKILETEKEFEIGDNRATLAE